MFFYEGEYTYDIDLNLFTIFSTWVICLENKQELFTAQSSISMYVLILEVITWKKMNTSLKVEFASSKLFEISFSFEQKVRRLKEEESKESTPFIPWSNSLYAAIVRSMT